MASRIDVRRPSSLHVLYSNAFELMIACSAVIVSVAFAISPSSVSTPPLHQALNGWDRAWYLLDFLGGVHVIVGLLLYGQDVRIAGKRIAGDGRVELAGLCFLGTALLVNQVALVYFGYLATVGMLTYLSLLVACVIRGRVILATRKAQVPFSVPAKGGQ